MHRDRFAIQVHSQGEVDNLLKTLDSEMTINGHDTFWESWKEYDYQLFRENDGYIRSSGGSIVIYYVEVGQRGWIFGWNTIEGHMGNNDFENYVTIAFHDFMARFAKAVTINISSDNLLEMLG